MFQFLPCESLDGTVFGERPRGEPEQITLIGLERVRGEATLNLEVPEVRHDRPWRPRGLVGGARGRTGGHDVALGSG
jgi:hypothetical protein